MAKVVNVRDTSEDQAVYIGRPSKWGNPFKISRFCSRFEAIEKFRDYGKKKGLDVAAKKELKGKDLACFCAPQPCHGDVLLEWANVD
jgi:hypothetical protein